jgi:uncharacterized protein YndB with AHSA1/START domain
MADLMHEIHVDAPADRVYAALATQAGLQSWWTADTIADATVGGAAQFGFEGRSAVFRMRLDELTPGRRVAWSCHGDHPEWTGTRLTWDLAPADGATAVRFTHAGWREASRYMASCNTTWGELMHRLKAYAEGKAPGPRWTR